jgi:hypothetical protein
LLIAARGEISMGNRKVSIWSFDAFGGNQIHYPSRHYFRFGLLRVRTTNSITYQLAPLQKQSDMGFG